MRFINAEQFCPLVSLIPSIAYRRLHQLNVIVGIDPNYLCETIIFFFFVAYLCGGVRKFNSIAVIVITLGKDKQWLVTI